MMSAEIGTGASRRLRWVVCGLATATLILAVSTDPAEARRKRSGYNPAYASIVVDANSGAVLQETHADSRRHPASLAKIMTLYLLFEQLESGRLKLSTPLPVSARAAAQPPTKLGLKPGQSIQVEDAILALVTRSGNDIAVVVAEAIGETEAEFARMMTRKARALGMRRTTYTNASGLPDSDQITTARDQALLGRAIQERFPRYYRYFATESFVFRGRRIRTHNRVMARLDGVDGIKTGYTRASGFNLVTSMHRGRRHVVAVVLGGRSASQRDARMRALLSRHIKTASTRRTAPVLAEAPAERRRVAAHAEPVPLPPFKPIGLHKVAAADVAAAEDATASTEAPSAVSAYAATSHLEPGSTDPIKPLLVKTVSIKPALEAPRKTFAAVPLPPLPPATADAAEPTQGAVTATEETPEPVQAAAKTVAPEKAKDKPVRSGWMIQVGAFGEEEEARVRLSAARSRAKTLLGDADPFTEPVTKGEKTLYRARFAGLDKSQAEAACRTLKRNEIACLTLKN